MRQSRYLELVAVGVLIAIFVGVALFLRVGFTHSQVFIGDQVRFTGTDAYYHMRLVDNLLHHFPSRITFDPYTFYPHGSRVPWPPFFDWFIAGTAWILGLGSPTQQMANQVGAWLPPILGALMVIPVYFIGKELFNRWVGVISAGLIAVHPGGFLSYSMLGNCDHHMAEALFSTLTMLFLLLGIKHARLRGINLSDLGSFRVGTLGKPLLYGFLAGVFFGIYLLNWAGGLLLLLLLFVYFVVQSIIDHLRGNATDYLLIIALPLFLVGGAVSLPSLVGIWTGRWFVFSFPVAIVVPAVLVILSTFLARKGLRRFYYPVAVVGLGLVVLAMVWIINPSFLKSLLWTFRYVSPSGAAMDIWEAQPLLFQFGKFSLTNMWHQFTTGFLLSLISLGLLIYSVIKRNDGGKTLLLVWSLLILFAVLGQQRYSYYFAVNVSLLTAYLSWCVIQFIVSSKAQEKPAKLQKKSINKNRSVAGSHKDTPHNRPRWSRMVLGAVVVLVLVFIPNIVEATNSAKRPSFTMNDAWAESLSWLRLNTPEPFGRPDFYYELYEKPEHGDDYTYPESAYGVMAYWDYGHWITRVAHRVPVSNPLQQGAGAVGQYFSAYDENSANSLVKELGVKYIMVDERTTIGFYGIATWAGLKERDFYDIYYTQQGNLLTPVMLFYPAYYKALGVRLYNFEGKEVVPVNCRVISYAERTYYGGVQFKEIISTQTFPTYEEAEDYISKQPTGTYRIVSDNPFVSPVPLEALEHYRMVYSSEIGKVQPDVGMVPTVKIFEYED